jgi:hypothetical protein
VASFHKEYAAVFWPDPVRVLGVRILPVTISHALFLWRIKSPLMVGGKMDIPQLVLALYVLSRPCIEDVRCLQRWDTRWLLKLWALQIKARCREVDRVLARAMLESCMDDAFEGPSIWEAQENTGRKCGAPYLLVLKVKLQERLSCTREQAMKYPLREAIWDLAAEAEVKGLMEWVQPEQAQGIEGVKCQT